jgi:hypothetical protein
MPLWVQLSVSIIKEKILVNNMSKHFITIKTQFWKMLFFALFFASLGWLLPYSYYKYIDKRVYFTYYSVETTQTNYKLCDKIDIHVHRHSELDTTGTITLQLLEKDDHKIVHQHVSFNAPITSGPKEFDDSTIILPCDDLKPGTYYYEGSLKYHVDRVSKVAVFTTNYFNIIK